MSENESDQQVLDRLYRDWQTSLASETLNFGSWLIERYALGDHERVRRTDGSWAPHV